LSYIKAASTSALSTLSLHDALPICKQTAHVRDNQLTSLSILPPVSKSIPAIMPDIAIAGPLNVIMLFSSQLTMVLSDGSFIYARSEEHTSELQSRRDLVCRLLLEKK